jgi:hypothetical protein
MHGHHTVSGVLSVLFTLTAVSGCGQAHVALAAPPAKPVEQATSRLSVDERAFQTPAQVRADIPAALKAFDGTFPDGDQANLLLRLQRTFDQQSQNAAKHESMRDGPGLHEKGAAESVVLDVWMCSWEDVYLAAAKHGDSSAVQRAGAQLATWYDLGYAKKWVDDPERTWEAEVLLPAFRGDIRPMNAEHKRCPKAAMR